LRNYSGTTEYGDDFNHIYHYSTNLGNIISENLSMLAHLTEEEFKDEIRRLYLNEGITYYTGEGINAGSSSHLRKNDEIIDEIVESAMQYKDSIDDMTTKQE
jgi:hypothetical protein